MSPNAAQLTAAVAALINALVASKFSTSGVMGMLNKISYARWGLEGYVIAETNYLTGGRVQCAKQMRNAAHRCVCKVFVYWLCM